MTIQQAKNREFDHVIALWPYTIPNDVEQRRRLLYNAITRAKRSCLVLVQAENMLPGLLCSPLAASALSGLSTISVKKPRRCSSDVDFICIAASSSFFYVELRNGGVDDATQLDRIDERSPNR